MGQQAAGLLNLVEVGGRFRRAVNVTRDAGSPEALDGYLVTPAVRRALSPITSGIDDAEGDRAWSLVGPYGSGKSAFAGPRPARSTRRSPHSGTRMRSRPAARREPVEVRSLSSASHVVDGALRRRAESAGASRQSGAWPIARAGAGDRPLRRATR